MRARSAVRAILAAALVAVPSAAKSADGPVVYKWVDADGIAHFTTHLDRVPSAVRDKVRDAATAPAPAPAAQGEQTTPDVAAGPPAPAGAAAPPGEFRESERPSQQASPEAPLGTPDAGDARELAATAPAVPGSLDARIAALEQEIGRDQSALESFLSEEPQEGAPLLPDRPDFREIAHRLPKLQAELARLKEERAHQGTP